MGFTKGNTFSKGRPKGSKNKNPYPITEAVKQRFIIQVQNPAFIARQGSDNSAYYTPEVREKMSKIKSEQIKNGGGVLYQGNFKIKNRSKYKGNPDNIVYRSSWELTFMMRLDNSPDVVSWASEEIIIPYTCPVDGRFHRYIPDFFVEKKDGTKFIIEIKPAYQTVAPKKNIKGRKLIVETKTYARNLAKWESAERFCKKHGWNFQILTEKELKVF